MTQKKFSIIIPTLNETQSIVNCLSALQTYRVYAEIIVVDGGSTDNTDKQALSLADKVMTSDRGRAIQMNAGANVATGDVLIFLHADTFLPKNALNRIATNIDDREQWGRFDIELKGRHPMLKVVASFMNWRSRLTGIATGDQAIFVNKALFDSIGGYPEIGLMEDIALSKLLKGISSPVCLKDKVLSSGRRWEQFGVYKTILLMWSLRLRYFFGTNPAILSVLYREGKWWKT